MNHTSESEKLPQVAQFPAKRLKGKKKKKQNKTIIHTKIEEICQKNKNISYKEDKNYLTKHFVHKELRRSDFLIAIKEYVGARETPSSTTKR